MGCWNASLACSVPLEMHVFQWIPSHFSLKGNEKADAAGNAGLLKRVTYIPIWYGDFRKHINVPLRRKWQSTWDEAVYNKLHANAGLLKRVTYIPILYSDFGKPVNDPLRRKWQSTWDEAVFNKLHANAGLLKKIELHIFPFCMAILENISTTL